jgi:hypothetical protein
MVYRLLKGYLVRSAWLFAFLGLVQFLMTGFYWMRGFPLLPIAGAALGPWGAAAALNSRSLVWRSLPLTPRDAGLYRWWAMAGAPGIFLTLITVVSWAWARSSGFPIPSPARMLLGIAAVWAALGVLAVLPRAARRFATRRWAVAAATIACVALLGFGLPIAPVAQPYSAVFIALGILLLLISAAQAKRGEQWRWPDVVDRAAASAARQAGFFATHGYGFNAILIPLAQRTVIIALAATVIVAGLLRFFPGAGMTLIWVYFIGISTSGFILTYQVRRAIQPLRCLPLRVNRLAGLLLLFGALPGIATLAMTLLVNRAILNVGLNFSHVATFALVIISSQALPVGLMAEQERIRGRFLNYWMPLIQRILVPVYLGLMAAGWSTASDRLSWWRWPLQAAGIALCFLGYFTIVHQLRAGIRPSSNEGAFSPG